MQKISLLFFFCFFITAFHVDAQMCLKDVEMDRIGQYKIQEFVENQQRHGIETFEEIEPSMNPDSDTKGYFVRENEYQVKKDIEDVWQHYLTTNPEKLWCGKRVSFGFLFSKKENKIIYCKEEISHIDTGMIIYLNLRLMSGLKNVATAFEFTEIDSKNRVIEFSYLKGNVSIGKQRLQFYETPKGYTRIMHTSFYKNNNFIRNYLLYPYFHTRTTHEFYRNNKKLMLLE